jgi:divalent metal cation (Fe/Co/Zn/Cd) transporter
MVLFGMNPIRTMSCNTAFYTTHPDVQSIHEFTTYYSGTDIEVEFHAEIDAEQSLENAHALETELIQTLQTEYDISDVHIHFDPNSQPSSSEKQNDRGQQGDSSGAKG